MTSIFAFLLFGLAVGNMLFVNHVTIIGAVILAVAVISGTYTCLWLDIAGVIAITSLILLALILSELLYMVFKCYAGYCGANLFAMMYFCVVMFDSGNSWLTISAALLCIPAAILVVTAITPVPFIKWFVSKQTSGTNSYGPICAPNNRKLSDGHLYRNDVAYASQYPNSYMDVYTSAKHSSSPKPTIFYIHGGGYIFGDKADGDPNADSKSLYTYFLPMLDAGYNIVSINYAFAPKYGYLTPIIQALQAMDFLQKQGSYYGVDMSQVILAGASAGGQIAGQLALIHTNPQYAAEIGIAPILPKDSIRGVIFNSALLDVERFSITHNCVFDYFFLLCGRCYFGRGFMRGNKNAIQSSIIRNATEHFPPSYISDGNTSTFYEQASDFHARLDALKVPNTFYFIHKESATLLHGYEIDGSDWADLNMEKQIEFLRTIAKVK